MTEEIPESSDNKVASTFFVTTNDPVHGKDTQEEEETTFVLTKTSQEKSNFRTIQDALTKLKIDIRRMQETNVLYICSNKHWKQKVRTYMEHIGTFAWIGPMTSPFQADEEEKENEETSNNPVQYALSNMKTDIILTLHQLFHLQAITHEQYEQMTYLHPSTSLDVNELYFLPALHHNEISVQPMVTSYIKEPIKVIASFLNILLQPLIEQIIHSPASLSRASEAIAAFELYVKQGYLQSTTLLTTIYIHDLGHRLPHHLMLEGLAQCLRTYVPNGQIEGTSTTTILQLVQLVLENQFYRYENQLYRLTAGGPMQTYLIQAFVDIYLFYLQDDLMSIVSDRKELFGRSLNQIFLTWNGSQDELIKIIDRNFLNNCQSTHPLQITTSIDRKIQYLDAEIGHYEGILQTRVYHNETIEPQALPYISGTKSTVQSHAILFRAALIRAILYCSNAIEYENERLFIDSSFLINDIAFDFIQKIYQNFLLDFDLFLGEQCIDEETYQHLRQRVRQYDQRRTTYYQRERQRRRKQRQRQIIKNND